MEVFAGSARITQCCRQAGLRADAIDHKPHALSEVEPILLYLTSPEGKRGLRSALAHPDLRAVWWAPPCGTASLARCIPLDVPNAPRPLRTVDAPDGVDDLSPVERARVEAANCLCHTLADSVKETIKRGIIHIVENPRGSLFWRASAWLRIRDLFHYTSFQACAYEGRRPKHTALAFTHPAFSKFCRSCPNCPDHLPWGQLRMADAKLWQLLAEKTRKGVQCTAAGRPLDSIFEAVSQSPEVLHILQPLPKSSGAPKFHDMPDERRHPQAGPRPRRQYIRYLFASKLLQRLCKSSSSPAPTSITISCVQPQDCSQRPAKVDQSYLSTSKSWCSEPHYKSLSRPACAWRGSMPQRRSLWHVSASCVVCL